MKRLVFDMPVMVWIGVEQEDFSDACGSSFSGTMNFVRLNGVFCRKFPARTSQAPGYRLVYPASE
jgi:hypothetical protein